MLCSQPVPGMGAPSLPHLPLSRHFPQWSRTAILTITNETAEEYDESKIKKSPPEPSSSGFYIGSGDATARIAHLEHSVRFLQEQHRQMLSGLHAEIESLRERNRDLQFQLIFNKEPSKPNATGGDDNENQMTVLRREVERLETEAAAARSEANTFERKAIQLQQLVDAQELKLRSLEQRSAGGAGGAGGSGAGGGADESRAELRARLAEAERLVRRLRGDAERQRRELQCMKNSLIRASGMDAFGFQNFQYPHMHTTDFWREPLREEYSMGSRGRNHRRPNTLPELSAVGQQIRSTVYANHMRVRGHPERVKKSHTINGETHNGKSPEESSDYARLEPINRDNIEKANGSTVPTYPELKIVVTKIIPHGNVSTSTSADGKSRTRRPHRKNGTEQT
ncbi:uncharacterized protein LOC123696462 isoform X2 [Colias croceus]|uniref:uncharacterized protein LOC123696462 isoform X2 n=1 Tax=Colias crocea TaxID=72248 RepID=UPI001E27D466|nr:uncharacterized protein LOC123696462 isoform X2 [Colias croceus]